MGFENYSKKEKPKSKEKWFKLAKKVFGFDTEFSVDDSERPFTFDCNMDSKKMKIGTNTETVKILSVAAILLILKMFFPKVFEETRRSYFEQKNSQA